MPRMNGPYHVEAIETPQGRRWRLAGPGLAPADAGKSYPWDEVREKLTELAELMNFAWGQARRDAAAAPSPEPASEA